MKKSAALILILAVVAVAAAVTLTACATVSVTFDLNGGTVDGSGESVVMNISGQLDLSEILPEKEDSAISGWTDEEGNFYGAYSVITPQDGMRLTAVYEGVLEYTRVDDGYAVSATEGYAGVNVVIPEEYNGMPVTEVAENAFSGCTSMKTLRIPDSVKRVGKGALSGCTSLESIVLPFAGASADTPVGVNNMGMAHMFGFSGGSSWAKDYGLKQVTVTDAATVIPNGAFEGMTSLQYVNLGENITEIGARAFSNCSNLVSVTLPEKCVSIGAYAFANCRASITVKGAITSLGLSSFYNSGITAITLGEGITSVPANCFEGSSSLRSITLPSSVTSVGSAAFRNCKSLTSVTINSVVTLYSSAFSNCTRLTSVTVNSVVTLHSSAFSECGALTNDSLHFSSGGSFAFAEGVSGDTATLGSAFYRTGVTMYN